MSYGGYYGGDPRLFHPDEEVCTPAELANHKEHCDAWDKGLRPEPDGHIRKYDETGRLILHIARNPFGLGVTVDEDENEDELEEPTLPLDELEDEDLMDIYLTGGDDAMAAQNILRERNGIEVERDDV